MIHDPTFKPGPKERRFLDALRELFVGAEVKGKSGYINLMRIKSKWFREVVEPALFEEIAKNIRTFPEFREELFDKLNAFFSRYFSRSGSICFAYTPQHMSVYERVYTDEQDVVLFWKTHMLHYVKTDRLFNDLSVEIDGHSFFFDCAAMAHKKSNEKRELVYTLEKIETKKDVQTIRLTVDYSERGRKTKDDEILKAIHKAGIKVGEATLDKAMRLFGRQSEVDYFINKDAGGFLREQFDLWMYQYVFKDETHWTEPRIRQLQVLKDIAGKLITFIAQFEDELLRIWTKPKFVRNSHYVITLDRISGREGGMEVLAAFLKHTGMKAQTAEWLELGIVDGGFDSKKIWNEESRKAGKEKNASLSTPSASSKPKSIPAFLPSSLNPSFQSLPLDTRHFDKTLEISLLGLFDDLDNQLDGRLIKSENWQALNTLKEKYRNRVKCCYIDPPYNTGGDGFPYIDNYQNSSWMTMIQERIICARNLLAPKGVFFASIDAKERRHFESLLDSCFDRNNRVEELIWATNATKNQSPTYSTNHEYVEVYAKDLKLSSGDERMFREPKPGFKEMMDMVEKINPSFPTIEEIGEEIKKLFEAHRQVFRDELEEMGVEYDKNLDLWKGLYNYSHAEYRDEKGKYVAPDKARKANASIWLWREDNPSMPQVKEDSQKAEFRDPKHAMFRFYKPAHPITGNPCPAPKRGWAWPMKPQPTQTHSFEALSNDQRIVWGNDEKKIPQTKKFLHEVDTNVAKSVIMDYTDGEKQLTDLTGKTRSFPNPKPTTLISRFILQTTDENELVMDFFGGSGTTAHSVVEAFNTDRIRRKFLLVEAADYFDEILLPRVKRIYAASKWKGGNAVNLGGPGLFCKVQTLEQYEDAISRASYADEEDLFRNTKTDVFSQYVFFRDLKLVEGLELDRKSKKVSVHLDRLYPDIDLAETLSCITGKWIKRVTADEVEFADGSRESLTDPDWRLIKPFIFWGPVV